MGSGITKNLEYNKLTPDEQLKRLEDFKITYLDKSKKELRLTTLDLFVPDKKRRTFLIFTNKYEITFHGESEMIDFVCKLGRPFIVTEMGDYAVYFVYMPNINTEKNLI